MKCPGCKENIDAVEVVSKCYQTAHLEGKEVGDYEDVTIGETLEVHCSACDADITASVKA